MRIRDDFRFRFPSDFPVRVGKMGLSKWAWLWVVFLPMFAEGQKNFPPQILRGQAKQRWGFRTVPWCINGADEPEFRKYPLSEFKMLLDRNDQYIKTNDGMKYEINLYKIQVERERIGDSEFLLNTAHFQFKASRRREYNKSVLTDYEETFLEGLIVQPIFAPMGVGLPTGSFLDAEEFNCHDCEYPIGQVVGCKRKTWMNFMHPTILAFHHRMKTPRKLRKTSEDFCQWRRTQRYCHLCDASYKNCTIKKVVIPTAAPSSTNQTTPSPVPGRRKRQADVYEKCDRDENCGVLDVNNTNTKVVFGRCLAKSGQFICHSEGKPVIINVNSTKDCADTSVNPPIADRSKCDATKDPPEVCKRQELPDDIRDVACKSMGKHYGRTSEVHGNMVWYTHPCHYTRRIRFLFLAVHSFQKGHFSVQQSGEFALPGIPEDEYPNHNQYTPSPLFNGFRHFCEPKTPKNYGDDLVGDTTEKWVYELTQEIPEIDFSFSYDECIQNRSLGVAPPMCKVNESDPIPRVSFRDKKILKSKQFPPPKCYDKNSKAKRLDNVQMDLSTERLVAHCNSSCPTIPTTPVYVPTPKPQPPFIKRTFHGAVNFVTNFCIMPICIFIGRFYKETYNTSALKGAKSWYWMHMVGSGLSSVMMYFGYFSKEYVKDSVPHVYLGYAYMTCLLISYLTAWTRNTNTCYTKCMETVHGIFGYSCFFLALACMHTVRIGLEPKLFAYAIFLALLLFYIGMEINVCCMDRKFGMEPSRRHFPTVEAKFDDVPVPGSLLRKTALVFFTIIIFGLSLGTIYFE